MRSDTHRPPESFGAFQIVILVLTLVVMGALVADTAFTLPLQISSVLRQLDTVICLVFLVDFVIRFCQAPSKAAFLK